jgi:transposase-like protein
MPSTSSHSPDSTIIRTGSDGRLRFTPAQREELQAAYDRSAMSAMAFAKQHGVAYQTFIAWLRKRRQTADALPPDVPAFAEVMLHPP